MSASRHFAVSHCRQPGPRAVAAACLVVFGQPCLSFAQSRALTGSSATLETPIQLSTFEVTADKDVGYQAGNTTSGSRLNTSLKDTAAAVSVFTPEFLSDFGASTIMDLVGYAPNAQADFQDTQAAATTTTGAFSNETGLRVRGLASSRAFDFFETKLPVDLYNVERVELSSGPNSILFGFGFPGGLLNLMTKRAQLHRTSTSVRAQFGSWNYQRYEVDHNQRLIPGKLALRLNGVLVDTQGWRRNDFNDTTRGAASLRFSPWPTTWLVVNYENGKSSNHVTKPWSAFDGIALWQASGSPIRDANAWTANDRALGLNRSTNVRNIFVTGGQGVTFFTTSNANNFRILETTFEDVNAPVTSQAGITLLSPSQFPIDIGAYGPGSFRTQSLQRGFALIEQRIGKDIQVEFAYLKEDLKINTVSPTGIAVTLLADPNTTIPNPSGAGAPIPNPNAGRFYLDALWGDDNGEYHNDAVRGSVSWKLDLKSWGVHQLAGMAERGESRQWRYPGREILVDENNVPIGNATPENAANVVTRRQYIVPGDYSTYFSGDARQPITVQRNGRTYHSVFVNQNTNGGDTEKDSEAFLLATHSTFFDAKLVFTGGVRWDTIRYQQHLGGRFTADNPRVRSGEVLVNSVTFVPEMEEPFEYKPVTSSLGGVYHATKWLSVFYNHSNSNSQPAPNVVVLPDEKLPAPSDGATDDYGFMLSFLEGKLFLRATAFKTTEFGETRGISLNAGTGFGIAVPNNLILDALLAANRITQAEYQEHTLGDASNIAGSANTITKGYEVSAWLNATKNLTAVVNFSYTNVDRSDIMPEYDGWFEREKTFWAKGGDPGNLIVPSTNTRVAGEVANVERIAADARDFYGFTYGERPYKANASARYAFTEGRAKGVYFGTGIRWQSKPQLGRYVTGYTAAGSTIYGSAFHGPEDFKMDAFAGYRRKLSFRNRSPELTLQVNVTNLTDEDEVMPLRYNTKHSGYARVLVFEPRNIRFTIGLKF